MYLTNEYITYIFKAVIYFLKLDIQYRLLLYTVFLMVDHRFSRLITGKYFEHCLHCSL